MKSKKSDQRASKRPPAAPAVTPEVLQQVLRSMSPEQLAAALLAMQQTKLNQDDIRIGTRVAVKVSDGRYAPAEITDIFFSDTSGEYLYKAQRLDDASKGLTPKEFDQLFPAHKATLPTSGTE